MEPAVIEVVLRHAPRELGQRGILPIAPSRDVFGAHAAAAIQPDHRTRSRFGRSGTTLSPGAACGPIATGCAGGGTLDAGPLGGKGACSERGAKLGGAPAPAAKKACALACTLAAR